MRAEYIASERAKQEAARNASEKSLQVFHCLFRLLLAFQLQSQYRLPSYSQRTICFPFLSAWTDSDLPMQVDQL